MKHIVVSRHYLAWRREECIYEVPDDFDLDAQSDSDWEDGFVDVLEDCGGDLVDAENWVFERDATEEDMVAVAKIDLGS